MVRRRVGARHPEGGAADPGPAARLAVRRAGARGPPPRARPVLERAAAAGRRPARQPRARRPRAGLLHVVAAQAAAAARRSQGGGRGRAVVNLRGLCLGVAINFKEGPPHKSGIGL